MRVKIFFCYAHEDEPLLNKLKTHLMPLQRAGLIEFWYDRDISAGTEWAQQIKNHLNAAQIILLLVSPDFMASDYCYGIELKRALERHKRGEARVIPIILRPVYWQGVLGKLQALPTDAKPVMSSSWHYQDEAFLDVANNIRKIAKELAVSLSPPTTKIRLSVIDHPEEELKNTNLFSTVLLPDQVTHSRPNAELKFSEDTSSMNAQSIVSGNLIRRRLLLAILLIVLTLLFIGGILAAAVPGDFNSILNTIASHLFLAITVTILALAIFAVLFAVFRHNIKN